MVELLRTVVKPGGIFVSIDPCLVPGQHVVAKVIIHNDKRRVVRDPAGFERIVSGLGQVHTEIRHNLLRIPFTQIIMWVAVELLRTTVSSCKNVRMIPRRYTLCSRSTLCAGVTWIDQHEHFDA